MTNLTLILIIIIGVLILWLIFTYNRLVTLKMRVKEALSDIDVQLKRRANLIPNLVETVKGYALHEKSVLENVTEARSRILQAQTPHEKAEADNFLSETLKTLFAVAENYPDLKASTNFLELQRELRDAEDKIQAARRFYNQNVMAYNTLLKTFPSNLIAKIFNFKEEEFFEIEEEREREVPKVSF